MRWPDLARRAGPAAITGLLLAGAAGGAAQAQQALVPGPMMVSGGAVAPAGKGAQATVTMTVTNKGTLEDHLVRAACPDATSLSLQPPPGTPQDQAAQGVSIPPGQTVALTAAGWHLALDSLREPLTPGEVTACTVRFDRSGEQLVEVTVRPAGQ